MKSSLRSILGLLLATIFGWLIVRHVGVSVLIGHFRSVSSGWLIAALQFLIIAYLLRILRWHQMLILEVPLLNWASCVGPLLASYALNNLLPLRAGDAFRSFAFNNKLGCGPTVIFATLLVERTLDLSMVLILLTISTLLFGISLFSSYTSIGLIILVLVILFVSLSSAIFRRVARPCGLILSCLSPSVADRIALVTSTLFSAIGRLALGGKIKFLVILSFFIWSAEGFVFFFAAMAFNGIKIPTASWLALPMGTLATLIPSTPGYIGTFDYFVVRAMTVVGNEVADATAYALFLHLLLWLPVTLTGCAYVLFSHVKILRFFPWSKN